MRLNPRFYWLLQLCVLWSPKISNKYSLQHSKCCLGSKIQNTSLLLWNLFTGFRFMNEWNTRLYLSQHSQHHSTTISLWPHIYSASSWSQHTLFTLCHSYQTTIIDQSHSPLLPTCFTSSLEPASYITQDSSSKLFSPLSATFIWICRSNFLHTAIIFHHFFTASL